ncbi:tail protein X [Paenibacillus lautus]|uniref:tail protein X n=1 Tax=Paenibacillus lautus TaxID=1401 RepID=UPI003D291DCC
MTTYTTIQGDTWDSISFKVYGEEEHVTYLMRANPEYIRTTVFSGGITLMIPPYPVGQSSSLPPWKKEG